MRHCCLGMWTCVVFPYWEMYMNEKWPYISLHRCLVKGQYVTLVYEFSRPEWRYLLLVKTHVLWSFFLFSFCVHEETNASWCLLSAMWRDSSKADVFARIAWSFTESASVIVSLGYSLLLAYIIILIIWDLFTPAFADGFSAELWASASLFKSPELFLVFWPISTML